MTARTAIASTVHEPVGNPAGPGLWHHKGWQLPAYIQHVANDLREKGHPESRAINLAVGIVRNWAHGHDGRGHAVSPEVQAAAVKAMAEWEALKARAAASRTKSLTAAPATSTVDLAFVEAQHPRAPKGSTGGGKFVAKTAGTSGSRGVTRAQLRDFQRRHGLATTGRFDKATLAKLRQAQTATPSAASSGTGGSGSGSSAKATATASAVNRLTAVQRAAYKSRHPQPPTGYRWEGTSLVTADRARLDRRVRREAAGRTMTIPRSLARRIRRVLRRTGRDLRMAALAPGSVLDLTTGPIATPIRPARSASR